MSESTVNVAKLKAGDQDELKTLIESLAPQLHRWVRLRATYMDPLDADDVVQEALLRIYRNIDKYGGPDEPAPFMRWCQVVARNVALEHLRRCRLRERRIELCEPTHEQSPPDLDHEELQQALSDALERLTAEERHLVEARFFEGKTYSQIATELQVSLSSVHARLRRATEKLRQAILKKGLWDF